MKKKIIKILSITLISILIILLINYIRININYNKYKNNGTYTIQGTNGYYRPQSITYSDKYNVIIQTSYNKKHKTSKIYITDFNTGKLIKELELYKEDNSINNTHVGGITTNNDKVWITGDYEISEYNLEEILSTQSTNIKAISTNKLKNRGDTCTYSNNILWIGDFYLYPIYKVPNNKPLLLGYNVDSINYNNPNYSIIIPKMVQGIIVTDNNIIISQSYTYLINSKLRIYNINNNTKKLDNSNLDKTITLPPMAEGMFIKDNDIYILFESNSNSYKGAYPKIKKILKISI